jgi:hypothetical protein
VSICTDKAAAADDGFDQTSYEDGNSTVMFLMKVVCLFFWQLMSIFHDLEGEQKSYKVLSSNRPCPQRVCQSQALKLSQ